MASQEIKWLLEEKYQGEKTEGFFADCKRLALGEPLAYLIGHVPFLGCKINLDGRPLIPRPETEFWTEEAIVAIRGGETIPLGIDVEPVKILDLCAGSGCIGTAVAKSIPTATVDFSEIDEDLITTITKNLEENLEDTKPHQVIHSNLFSNITGKYDFILSNPPYIDPAIDRAEKSVKEYEPYVALYGGFAGMEIIESIIEKAPEHLVKSGQLWLEHEPEQSEEIARLAHDHGFTLSTHKDQFGIERYSILVLA